MVEVQQEVPVTLARQVIPAAELDVAAAEGKIHPSTVELAKTLKTVLGIEAEAILQDQHDLNRAGKRIDTLAAYIGNGLLTLDTHMVRNRNGEAVPRHTYRYSAMDISSPMDTEGKAYQMHSLCRELNPVTPYAALTSETASIAVVDGDQTSRLSFRPSVRCEADMAVNSGFVSFTNSQ